MSEETRSRPSGAYTPANPSAGQAPARYRGHVPVGRGPAGGKLGSFERCPPAPHAHSPRHGQCPRVGPAPPACSAPAPSYSTCSRGPTVSQGWCLQLRPQRGREQTGSFVERKDKQRSTHSMRQVFRGMNRPPAAQGTKCSQRSGEGAGCFRGLREGAKGIGTEKQREASRKDGVGCPEAQGPRHSALVGRTEELCPCSSGREKRHSHTKGQNACVEANSEAIHLHSWSVCGGDFSEVTELLGEMTQDFSFPPTSHPTRGCLLFPLCRKSFQ